MNRSDKIKRITLIFLAVLASGYFMYTGFSILMSEDETTPVSPQGITEVSE
ncbi:MAG: hypothetical protein WBG65_03310 [Sulfurimonadaceae bacterium]